MNRLPVVLLTAVILVAPLSVQAFSYYGYVRNWEPETNGDAIFDLLSNSDVNTTTTAHFVTGQCGASAYRLKAGKANFDETFASLLLATKNNYRVLMNVTSCAGTINIIDSVKVCTWTGNC